MNDIRRWMMLCEFVHPHTHVFYHGSKKNFPIGFILEPQSDGYVHGVVGDEFDAGIRRVESIIERFRPSHMISRLGAVFLSPTINGIVHAGGHQNYIYQVSPIGSCEQSCLWWYHKIEECLLYKPRMSIKLAKQYAENYWNNIPPPKDKPAIYEYRCRSAKIIG